MSDVMTPIPFRELMEWVLSEYKRGSVFGVTKAYEPKGKTLEIFGERLETPFGPAAGPHTQLTQNILAAYYAGARFFELKTVQVMDGEELAACIGKPCIVAEDECYNCEWSTELTVPNALNEYVKAWFMLKLFTKEFGWGDPNGFIFNMSVGYDFKGITTPKIDAFIEGLKDATKTEIWAECVAWTKENLHRFQNVDEAYLSGISGKVCTSITLSTLHGCPPQEIERIASYLIDVKKLNTFVKCNPTILGYATARQTLDELGFDYVSFDEHHFNEDLQYKDAVPMFKRLLALAEKNGVQFGLKLSNTFPVEVRQGELPSEEMYMSGRSLYPLTIEMAKRISEEFDGKLRLSFSGGIDAFNIEDLFEAGIWPITLATTLLKPGGYQRLTQLGELCDKLPYEPFDGVKVGKVALLSKQARVSERNRKPIKPAPARKVDRKVPLLDCFFSPCTNGCPIGQDIPEYVEMVSKGKYEAALELILKKNPLPFITGTICPHRCTDKCTRGFYEDAVHIRRAKLTAAENGYEAAKAALSREGEPNGHKVAVIGGGPAGMAAAFFLARQGANVTLFEKREQLGGVVRYVIPAFRIGDECIDRDAALLEQLGVDVRLGSLAPSIDELEAQGYSEVVCCIGAWKEGTVRLAAGEALNGIRFLELCKNGTLGEIGTDVVVIGGGNTAMDAARMAKRVRGVKNVRLVYRRTAKFMPADAEELELAREDGVQFLELLAPMKWENGTLTCRKMVLGEPDASGRRSPVETEETVEIPCTQLIAAVGEKVEGEFFTQNGIALNERGKVVLDANGRTSRKNVYVAGDCLNGPATVVEAIRDARKAADAIVGKYAYSICSCADTTEQACQQKHGILKDYECAEKEAERCLRCGKVCECCVQVCPNRANVAITVKGMAMPQIIHVDRMCNECGNCLVFCPYDSRPYLEKWTLFATEKEFDGSKNKGFLPLGGRVIKVRTDTVSTIDLDKDEFDAGLKAVCEAVLDDYSYLIG